MSKPRSTSTSARLPRSSNGTWRMAKTVLVIEVPQGNKPSRWKPSIPIWASGRIRHIRCHPSCRQPPTKYLRGNHSIVRRMQPLPETSHARKFGKYTLVAKLAQGGMAEIFLARLGGAAGFEKLVCIKRILPSYAE